MFTEKHQVLREIDEENPEIEIAKRHAVLGRALLDIKRDGTYKARFVKRGDLEGTSSDPDGFNYYAQVVSLESVRALIATHNHNHSILCADVATAFLQSDRFPEGMVKYVKIPNPLNGNKPIYFSQHSSLYGEKSAPKFWLETVVPWIVSQGFLRGKNDPCVFFNQARQLTILLYVDDVLVSGPREQAQCQCNL